MRLDKQKTKDLKRKNSFEEYREELNKFELKIDKIEKKQEKMERKIDVAYKNTEEGQIKQIEMTNKLNKKIDGLSAKSSDSIDKLKWSIEDTYQIIENSCKDLNKNFKLKIGNTFN